MTGRIVPLNTGGLWNANSKRQSKRIFIYETADKLRERLSQQFGVSISIDRIKTDLEKLVTHSNLRYIKRRIEDIVFNEFYNNYSIIEPML
mgnify:CR=1 FL=1